METALWTLLTGSSAVTAICGQRIYWGEAPQGSALPGIVMHIISGSDTPHLRGTDGLWTYTVQVDCYAADRPSTKAVSDAVLATLNGHGGQHIRASFVTSVREDIEDAANARPARISHDFTIIWRA